MILIISQVIGLLLVMFAPDNNHYNLILSLHTLLLGISTHLAVQYFKSEAQ